MKKIILSIISCILVFVFALTTYTNDNHVKIRRLPNGSYFITEVQKYDNLLGSGNIKKACKTINYYDINKQVLWYVRITASFRYNGNISTCTSATVSAVSNSPSWKINDTSIKQNGNISTATASVTQYAASIPIHTYQRSVTLQCDKNGNLY